MLPRLHTRHATQVARVLGRSSQRRLLAAWRRAVSERWWKTQCTLRDQTLAALEARLRAQRKHRAVLADAAWLRRLLRAWRASARISRGLRVRGERAAGAARRRASCRAWLAW